MERRKTPRTSIRKLGYVNFEPYNTGGVITDISASGLRFHTVTPVQQGGVVRLSLTLGTTEQIEAVGELVWTDSTRKIGGVRFVVLPPTAVDQIQNWARANSSEVTSETESTAPAVSDASPKSTKTLAVEPVGVANQHNAPAPAIPPQSASAQTAPPAPELSPNARTPWVPPSARPYSAASSISPQSSDAAKGNAPKASTPPHGFALPGQPNTMPWITHFDPDPSERSAFTRGLIGGVIVCLLLASLAWFGLRRYVGPVSSLWSANPSLSNPASAESSSAPANSALPAPDLPASADANSAAPNPSVANPPATNPVDTKSVTAANTAKAPSDGSAPNSSANPPTATAAQSSPAAASETKPAAKPEATRPADSERPEASPEQSPARSPVLASGPRDVAPDSLALASQRVSKTPAPAAAPEPADDGETQLILAWQYLEGQGGKPRDPTAASQLLWSAVQKGNLTAETTLANLYIRGEGVPKNCDQARVLLSAASEKGSAEAKRKLAELNQTGCR